jgi:uncharacterized protein YggU (UPF0235/DUF167 family)
MARPWTAVADGLLVTVRLTPKGGRDAVDGIEHLADGSSVLKARVRAAPHEGAANDALVALLARELGVRRGGIALVAGATARIKRLKIAGDPNALAAALERVAAQEQCRSRPGSGR